MNRKEKAYVAIAYSHKNPNVRNLRFRLANIVSAKLMEMGYIIFSPISHSHPIAQYLSEDKLMNFEFWMEQDLPYLEFSDVVFFVIIDGIKRSKGFRKEYITAMDLHKTIYFVRPYITDDFKLELEIAKQ